MPGKPSNVSFSYKSNTEVRLSWNEPLNSNGRILGYSIRYWRADQSEDNAVNTQVPQNVKIFSATSLTPESTYYFAIKAENFAGWGDECRIEVITVLKNCN